METCSSESHILQAVLWLSGAYPRQSAGWAYRRHELALGCPESSFEGSFWIKERRQGHMAIHQVMWSLPTAVCQAAQVIAVSSLHLHQPDDVSYHRLPAWSVLRHGRSKLLQAQLPRAKQVAQAHGRRQQIAAQHTWLERMAWHRGRLWLKAAIWRGVLWGL